MRAAWVLVAALLVGCSQPAATTRVVHVSVLNEAHFTARVNVTLHEPGREDKSLQLVAPLVNDSTGRAGPVDVPWDGARVIVGAHEETTGHNHVAEVFPEQTPNVTIMVRDDAIMVVATR